MKCPLIYFTKHLGNLTAEQMIEKAQQFRCDGFDLACRSGQTVTPENVSSTLPKLVKQLHSAGLVVPMITGNGNLLEPTDPTAEPILGAMQEAGVTLLKMGYFPINNKTEDYWEKVAYARNQLEGWARLGERYGVRICYHTHSGGDSMGINAAAVMHLLHGFDPRWVGAYLDAGHQLLDGEHPDIAFNMVKRYLAIVAVKDARKEPDNVNAGYKYTFCRAGRGDVDWQNYFENLRLVNFQGPISVHGLYERYMASFLKGDKSQYFASLHSEFDFFRRYRDGQQLPTEKLV